MPFWLVVAWIAVTIISIALQYALRPKIQKRGPGELQAPVCEQGYPIAYVAGCAKIRGANVVWKGDTKTKGKQSNQIYDYWCRMQMVICHGRVQRMRRVWFGQDIVPTTRIVGQSGGAANAYNVMGIQSATTYNSAPYPAGKPLAVGNQDAYLGTIVLVGSAPVTTGWGLTRDGGRAGNVALVPKAGAFAKYTAAYSTDRSGRKTVSEYRWAIVTPNLSDTVFRNSTFSRWDGAAWNAVGGAVVTAKQEFEVLLDSKEHAIKLNGRVRWYDGSENQEHDAHIERWQRGLGATPAYRGICYVVLTSGDELDERGFYWGESPAIPEISFEVQRVPNPLGLPGNGSPSETYVPAIDGIDLYASDANPANVIYELLTSPIMGLGVTDFEIDLPSFRDAGRILQWEGLGITFVLDQQMAFDDAIKELNMVADGVLFEDPATGLWTYRLIREPISSAQAEALDLETDFYSRTDWTVFDENDFSGEPEYTRGSWGDVANQIKVQYIDRSEGYAQRVVDVQDIGNYLAQNEVVTIQNTYNAVTSREVAIRLAYRDLRSVGTPRARFKDRINKRGSSLRPADCFVVNRPDLGIANMRFRVTNIRYGTMTDPVVEVEAIEDVFGMPDTIYTEPGSGWVDPSTIPPEPPAAIRAWEMAYDVTRDGPRAGFAALVARGDVNTSGAVLWAMVGGTLQRIGPIDYTPSGILSGSLGIEERTGSITLQGLIDFAGLQAMGSAFAGDNLLLVDDELIAFEGIGQNPDGTAYLSGCWRGVLDTIPRAHDLGARVWIIRRPPPVTPAASVADREELFAIQATSAGGETDPLGQLLEGGTSESRQLRPIVPGKWRVESADLAGALSHRILTGDVDVAWETRNRLTQAPGAVAQDEDSVDPEVGQNARLRIAQGIANAFRPYTNINGSEEPYPFGVPFRLTGVGAAPTFTWMYFLADDRWFYRMPSGISQYFDSVTGQNRTTTQTEYVYADLTTGFCERSSSLPTTYDPARWNLFRLDWVRDGADMLVTVTDLRGTRSEGTLLDSPTETDHAVTPDEVAALNNIGPYLLTLDSTRDGLESWEQRQSGMVFPAGWGMSWGLHWGGDGT